MSRGVLLTIFAIILAIAIPASAEVLISNTVRNGSFETPDSAGVWQRTVIPAEWGPKNGARFNAGYIMENYGPGGNVAVHGTQALQIASNAVTPECVPPFAFSDAITPAAPMVAGDDIDFSLYFGRAEGGSGSGWTFKGMKAYVLAIDPATTEPNPVAAFLAGDAVKIITLTGVTPGTIADNTWVQQSGTAVITAAHEGWDLAVLIETGNMNGNYVIGQDYGWSHYVDDIVLECNSTGTPPIDPCNANPTHNATDVAVDANITWTPDVNAIAQAIYFGTDYSAVADANRPSGDLNGNSVLDIGDINIISQGWLGSPTGGMILSDLNNDGDINLPDMAILSGQFASGASADAEFQKLFDGDTNSFTPSLMQGGQNYYWRLDPYFASTGSVPNAGTVMKFTTAHTQITDITFTLLDDDATGYGTFQSHNQKVVQIDGGIFTSHLTDGNPNPRIYRISRSTDGGSSFSTVYEGTTGDLDTPNPPTLETDGNDVYIFQADHYTSDLWMGVLTAPDYNSPTWHLLHTDSSNWKHTTYYDSTRDRFYFLGNGEFGKFIIAEPNGTVLSAVRFTQYGTSGEGNQLMYPHISMDGSDIYVAWTNEEFNPSSAAEKIAWSIHVVKSLDGGSTWTKLDGTALTLPIIADDSGPADEVTLPSERADYTSWLWSFTAKNGKLHFGYGVYEPPVTTILYCTYVRLNANTGVEEKRTTPWSGNTTTFHDSDGFVAVDPCDPNIMYWTAEINDGPNKMGTLYTTDGGDTWNAYARQDAAFSNSIYAVGGAREVTSDGYIMGTFTLYTSPVNVYFFKIPAGLGN